MILHEMLASTSYYGQVLIYARNAYDQCVEIFQGSVENARKDEYVWDYLTYEVDQWICGNHWTLIYVKHYAYEDRLETCYLIFLFHDIYIIAAMVSKNQCPMPG